MTSSSTPAQPPTTATPPPPMSMNLLMMSWVAAFFPHAHHQALLCMGGSDGYHALRRSLGPGGYPQHTILITNVDIMAVGVEVETLVGAEVVVENEERADGDDARQGDISVVSDDDSLNIECDMHTGHNRPSSPPPAPTRAFSHIIREDGNDQRGHVVAGTPIPYSPMVVESLEVRTNMSAFPDWFMEQCLKRCSPLHIDFSGCSNVLVLPRAFLSGLPFGFLCNVPITSFDCTPFTNVAVLPTEFMMGCTGLKTISLGGLNNVTSIHERFLSGCTGLTSIDCTPFTSVTVVGESFMENCTGLKSISFEGLSYVTSIHERFMGGCTGLTSVDFTPFTKVTDVGMWFLSYCTGLTTISFEGLNNVTTIQGGFMMGCTGLTSIDCAPFTNVTTIQGGFMMGCTGLKTISFEGLNNVSTICKGFLAGCTGLTSLDLSPLTNWIHLQAPFNGPAGQMGTFLSNSSQLNAIHVKGLQIPPPAGWVQSSPDTWSRQHWLLHPLQSE